jgi:hypothetical protein
MSTLSEIQAAVDELPRPEQEILLEHLVQKLGVRPRITEGARAQRERWLQKLVGGRRGLLARRACHSRRSSTTSAVSVADELLGFFSAGKALRARGRAKEATNRATAGCALFRRNVD